MVREDTKVDQEELLVSQGHRPREESYKRVREVEIVSVTWKVGQPTVEREVWRER
jgi:hypothetical protein